VWKRVLPDCASASKISPYSRSNKSQTIFLVFLWWHHFPPIVRDWASWPWVSRCLLVCSTHAPATHYFIPHSLSTHLRLYSIKSPYLDALLLESRNYLYSIPMNKWYRYEPTIVLRPVCLPTAGHGDIWKYRTASIPIFMHVNLKKIGKNVNRTGPKSLINISPFTHIGLRPVSTDNVTLATL